MFLNSTNSSNNMIALMLFFITIMNIMMLNYFLIQPAPLHYNTMIKIKSMNLKW